jgi:hypothetical protein
MRSEPHPIHVHARRDLATCKFWLNPVALADNHGLSAHDLTVVRRYLGAATPDSGGVA